MATADRAGRNPVATLARAALAILAVYGAYLFLSEISLIVRIFLAAALLAYILDPLVVYLESNGMKRLHATVIVFILTAFVVTVALNVLIPAVTDELNSLRQGMGGGKANEYLGRIDASLREKFVLFGAGDVNLAQMWHDFVADSVNKLLGYFVDAVTVATSFLLVPVITFFLLADGRGFKKRLVRLVPNYYFEFTLNLIHKMDQVLGRYLRGVLLDALIIGVFATLVLWGQGVKYYVVLGTIIGLANIIPYFGPIAGAVPAVLVALISTGDPKYAAFVAVGQLLVQVVDAAVVKPLVLSRMVDLHPLTVLMVVIIGGSFFGLFGLFLSVPVLAVMKVAFTETIGKFRQYYRDVETAAAPGGHDVYPGAA